ncbi:hypothetical protein DL95DRAFT_496566 [Leptodontidium sp. 2 PMI_412]|nr:hypothetical protein DL95DRAFT_496566 [Leptodontidium sp. 2 PMI_412]
MSMQALIWSQCRSQFTQRDLHRLGNYSPHSPLRVIALVDYDAFYAQCETVRLNLDPAQPLARLCPNIVLQHVATWREGESSWAYRSDAADPAMMKRDKAALDPYRIQSRKSLQIILNHLPPAPLQRIEKASVDEVFLDLSAQVHSILLSQYPQLATILTWDADHLVDFPADTHHPHQFDWDDITLNIGAQIIRELRKELLGRLHFTCSAGIAHNKSLAKLGAGCKKPNRQTVIRARAGRMLAALGGRNGLNLFRLIRGIYRSEVILRTDPQSMLTQKTFVPPLADINQASSWYVRFALKISITGCSRRPTTLVVHHHIRGRFGPTISKQCTIPPQVEIDEETIFSLAMRNLKAAADEVTPAWHA